MRRFLRFKTALRATAAVLAAVLTAVLAAGLAGCAGSGEGKDGEINIVATIFPGYDFVRALIKDVDGVNLRLLIQPGTESHTFDPSVSDALSLKNCDLLVCAGGDADIWAEKFLKTDPELKKRTVTMLDAVSEKLMIEGEDEEDPHIWTSPVNAIQIVRLLRDRLVSLVDNSSASLIRSNCAVFESELSALDNDFRVLFSSVSESERLLVFGDRFPFRYFCDEYGFDAVAVFPGCADESEPAAADVKKVVDTVRERGVKCVFYVELSNHRIADAIAAETGCTTACLHSCHNLSRSDFDSGETYLTLMRRNLLVLSEVFGEGEKN